MEVKKIEITVYATSDGALFKDEHEAAEHERTVEQADIICSRIHFFDDGFNPLITSYDKYDEVFYDENEEQFWQIDSAMGHAAYYHCDDMEAAEALRVFNVQRCDYECFKEPQVGYWDIRNDNVPVNLFEVIENAQNAINAMMKEGIKNESNS